MALSSPQVQRAGTTPSRHAALTSLCDNRGRLDIEQGGDACVNIRSCHVPVQLHWVRHTRRLWTRLQRTSCRSCQRVDCLLLEKAGGAAVGSVRRSFAARSRTTETERAVKEIDNRNQLR